MEVKTLKKQLFKEIDAVLSEFANMFSRKRTFQWFCIFIYGLLLRFDFRGVTSLIRCFNLKERCYEQILNFLHSPSWNLRDVIYYWLGIVLRRVNSFYVKGHLLFIGDATMFSKAAKKMPAVKKLHDSSQNNNRPKYFFGHYFGFISLLIGGPDKLFALPIIGEIQDGLKKIRKYQQKKIPIVEGKEDITTITLMLEMGCSLVQRVKQKSLLVLDGYYASKKTFLMAKDCINDKGENILQVIVRMKYSTVAYLNPLNCSKDRGRIKLKKLFQNSKNEFTTITINVYGKKETVSYLCLDLYWSDLTEKLRFVLVNCNGKNFILACSNSIFSPEEIIKIYSYRFKIEVTFSNLKHLLKAFDYHFWSKYLPKIKHNRKKGEAQRALTIDQIKAAVNKIEVIEGFVNFCSIALGILQILCIKYSKEINKLNGAYKRTRTTTIPTEEDTRNVLQSIYFFTSRKTRYSFVFNLIRAKQKK